MKNRERASSKTILLVEDSDDDVALTRCALRKRDICNPVQVAQDGVAALDYLFGIGAFAGRDITNHPVLVLLDLKLPKIDGIEVLRRIRGDARIQDLTVVVMTSSTLDEDFVAAHDLYVNSYVQKPLNGPDFGALVARLSQFWLSSTSAPLVPCSAP